MHGKFPVSKRCFHSCSTGNRGTATGSTVPNPSPRRMELLRAVGKTNISLPYLRFLWKILTLAMGIWLPQFCLSHVSTGTEKKHPLFDYNKVISLITGQIKIIIVHKRKWPKENIPFPAWFFLFSWRNELWNLMSYYWNCFDGWTSTHGEASRSEAVS